MGQNAKQIAELLRALANEHRLMILCALMRGPLTVGEIARYAPGITQSALSQHLTLLRAHGILTGHKSGQSVTYSIADHRVEAVVTVLQKYYCEEGELL